MPQKKREDYNAYMRVYVLNRYHQRMAQAIVKLGNICIDCGTTANLELDHVDPEKKRFTVAKWWSISDAKFWAEVAKCVLRCHQCHRKRHSAKQTHGTLSSYRYCKCDLCRAAKNAYTRNYREKHGRKPVA